VNLEVASLDITALTQDVSTRVLVDKTITFSVE
jgi:hypothetical protein